MTFKRGDRVHCAPTGNMEYPFGAEIEKEYENSFMVRITEFDQRDRWNVQELVGHTVIRKTACRAACDSVSASVLRTAANDSR